MRKAIRLSLLMLVLLITNRTFAQIEPCQENSGTYSGTWKDLNTKSGTVTFKLYKAYTGSYTGYSIIRKGGKVFTASVSVNGQEDNFNGYITPSVNTDSLNSAVFNCQMMLNINISSNAIKGEAVPYGCQENNIIYIELKREK